MNRRDFFRRSALIAAGVVAADQLDLIERLSWRRRRVFPAWGDVPVLHGDGRTDDTRALRAWVDRRPVWDAQERRMILGGPSALIARDFMVTAPVFTHIPFLLPEVAERRELSYCILRTTPRYEREWTSSEWYDRSVAEAKRRGVTPHLPGWPGFSLTA